jgi:hypothetical protein
MNERLGLLFSDGSILILPEGTDVATARDEAQQHDLGANGLGTQVVRLSVTIHEIIVAP